DRHRTLNHGRLPGLAVVFRSATILRSRPRPRQTAPLWRDIVNLEGSARIWQTDDARLRQADPAPWLRNREARAKAFRLLELRNRRRSRIPPVRGSTKTMALSIDEVAKVALLARLRLSPEELQTFTGQLNSIVHFVEQLQDLDTANVEPLAHGVE